MERVGVGDDPWGRNALGRGRGRLDLFTPSCSAPDHAVVVSWGRPDRLPEERDHEMTVTLVLQPKESLLERLQALAPDDEVREGYVVNGPHGEDESLSVYFKGHFLLDVEGTYLFGFTYVSGPHGSPIALRDLAPINRDAIRNVLPDYLERGWRIWTEPETPFTGRLRFGIDINLPSFRGVAGEIDWLRRHHWTTLSLPRMFAVA